MVLAFEEIGFSYRRGREVFSALSCEFGAGRTVLLGPNGAGKSTLLGLAATVLRPAHGEILYRGERTGGRAARRSFRRAIGWMPQQIRPVSGFTLREQTSYAGWLKGLSKSDAWSRALSALQRVELAHRADDLVSSLSGGQLRRLGIAQTIVHEARLVLMDEPTAGLDPAQRRGFRQLMTEVSSTADVIVSTHQTEDLADNFDNVVVLSDGRVRFAGRAADFLSTVEAAGHLADSQRAEAAYTFLVGQSAG